MKKFKKMWSSGNSCYHFMQNILSSCLLSKDMKIKMYRTIILSVVFMGMKLGLLY